MSKRTPEEIIHSTEKEARQQSVKSTEFHQEHSCKTGLRCIMVIENYDPAEVEGVISI